MKCQDSLYQSLRSDLGVLITHLGMSGLSSTVRLNFLCGDSCVRLSNTRATLAEVSAEVSAEVRCESIRGRRYVEVCV